MKEVEVKARLKDGAKVREALAAMGCALSAPVSQDDAIFVRNPGPVDVYLSNPEFLRLRVEGDGTVLFTLKYHPGRASDPASAPIECETVVGSREAMERALGLMGFTEAVRLRKQRMKTHHGAWEICVDDVEGLGSFIELEELADEEADVGPIHAAMHAFLASLGIETEDAGLSRYDILMLEKGAGNGRA